MSAATQSNPRLTPAEYLAFERAASERHEFFDGEVFAMAGASRQHSLIAGNIFARLHQALSATTCEVHGAELRVHIPATGLFTYPDISVACPPKFMEPTPLDTLVNPVLLIEVLSESTEAYDRGRKFENYRTIPSLREYVLVSQERIHIDYYSRQDSGDWLLHEVAPHGHLRLNLPCGVCELALSDVYARVF